jgi:transcriptional regulator with XRE-family HTH domain
MPDFTRDNLRRLMSQQGLSIEQVAACSGLDHRTIHGILEGTKRPHSRTLHRLAQGLKVAADEFFLDPSQLLYRRFDRDTNPIVAEVVESRPEVFQGWTEADFDELHSRFGAGGCLTAEGALAAAEQMNGNRATHEKLAVLLETSQADVIRGIVELMYEKTVAKEEERGNDEC